MRKGQVNPVRSLWVFVLSAYVSQVLALLALFTDSVNAVLFVSMLGLIGACALAFRIVRSRRIESIDDVGHFHRDVRHAYLAGAAVLVAVLITFVADIDPTPGAALAITICGSLFLGWGTRALEPIEDAFLDEQIKRLETESEHEES